MRAIYDTAAHDARGIDDDDATRITAMDGLLRMHAGAAAGRLRCDMRLYLICRLYMHCYGTSSPPRRRPPQAGCADAAWILIEKSCGGESIWRSAGCCLIVLGNVRRSF
jgi:hypothetical protein